MEERSERKWVSLSSSQVSFQLLSFRPGGNDMWQGSSLSLVLDHGSYMIIHHLSGRLGTVYVASDALHEASTCILLLLGVSFNLLWSYVTL